MAELSAQSYQQFYFHPLITFQHGLGPLPSFCILSIRLVGWCWEEAPPAGTGARTPELLMVHLPSPGFTLAHILSLEVSVEDTLLHFLS